MIPTRKRLSLLGGLTVLMLVLAACGGSTTATDSSIAPTTTTTESETTPAPTMPTTSHEHDDGLAASTTVTVPEDAGVELPDKDQAHRVTVANGEVVDGVATIQTEVGSKVHIVVTTDTADHIHVHGYDLFFDAVPGEPTDVMFSADIPGVFEIELEDGHLEIARLEVR